MRVTEIISEDTLMEVWPAAVIGTAVFSAVSLYLSAMSAKEIYDLLAANNYDPSTMSDDDWGLFLIDVIMLVPGLSYLSKFGKPTLIKMIPDSVKQRGGSWLRNHLKEKLSKIDKGPGTAKQKGVLKRKAFADFKVDAAKQYGLLPTPIKHILGYAVASDLVITYYMKLADLEDQYTSAQQGADTTELFGDTSKDKLFAQADGYRNKYLGELTLGLLLAFGAAKVSNVVAGFGKVFGVVSGGGMVGGLVQLPFKAVSMIVKLGGAALIPALINTDSGEKFLALAITEMITQGIGALSAAALELLYKGIDEASRLSGIKGLAAQAGLDATMPRTKIADPNAASGGGSRPALDPNIPDDLRVTKDASNPNVIYIGQVQVTDDQGFRTIGNAYKNMLSRKAKAAGIPDPTATLKPNPNVNYDI
jgi:hypothetical protein